VHHFSKNMCGIFGYVGERQAVDLLVDGLRRLEYRGYDSAGVALIDQGHLGITKSVGRVDQLAAKLLDHPVSGSLGIAHTRWATHGEPSDANSHPHLDRSGEIALVHNGVIENYAILKERLQAAGHHFHSLTDTEVLAHLIGVYFEKTDVSAQIAQRLRSAVKSALEEVQGTYGIAVIHQDCPDTIIAARRGSPLIIGVGKGENFISSDTAALAAQTQTVIYLQDFDLVMLQAGGYEIESLRSGPAQRSATQIEYSADAVEKGAFAHFMLKEIFEQPRTIENALRGRLNRDEATAVFGGLNLTAGELRSINKIILCACGTSWHAALLGEYLFEQFAGIPVEVEYSSEFRYRNPPIEMNTLVFVLSQSGETADTLAALRESKRKGHKTLAIVNVVGSTIAREADGGIYMHAGPEVGVAATKSFTSQTIIMTCLALLMGRLRNLSYSKGKKIIAALEEFPTLVEDALKQADHIRAVAAQIAPAKSVFFLGRQFNFPIALEGALKLKEISYIHAEGYPSGEIKHGPIALIEPGLPTVLIATQDDVYDKNISALEEIKARGGKVIALGNAGDKLLQQKADAFIPVPLTRDFLQPILNMIPLQLLSYYTAVARGCDVDKPRNLAKSVTVE